MSGFRRRVTVFATALATLIAGGTFMSLTDSSSVFGASPPTSGGYFATSAPGTALPNETACAVAVHRSPWEPRPNNSVANHTVNPTPGALGNDTDDWNATWHSVYKPRITGNFTGTTDEIIQWAACKWGFSDDLLRAQAVQESDWHQSAKGDREARSRGHCVYDDSSDPCPTSFSIIQIKWYYHPPHFASNSPQSSYPWVVKSTAFALDFYGAMFRGCYEQMSTYLGNTRGDLWGCVQAWFSGSYTPGGGSYAREVEQKLAAKAWRGWADQSGGTTPPTATSPPTPPPTVTTPSTPPPTTQPPVTAAPTTTTTNPTPTTKPTTTTVPPTTTTQPPVTDAISIIFCINSRGTIQSTRGGLTPQKCAHATDRRVVWEGRFYP